MNREEQIMLCLDRFNFATRKQLQIMMQLGGDRNAQRILSRMAKDGHIKFIRAESNIYYLTNKGKERIGKAGSDLGRSQIDHHLMRVDAYIKLGMPTDWINEQAIAVGEDKIIADAMYKKNGVYHFVEIDNTQTLRTNADKLKKYKIVSKGIVEDFFTWPIIVWHTTSDLRKVKLEELCKQEGLKYMIL